MGKMTTHTPDTLLHAIGQALYDDGHHGYSLLVRIVYNSWPDIGPLQADIDALRAERVHLQKENEELRNDLAHQPSGIVLDDRDRELLALARRTLGRMPDIGDNSAAYRLLCRLAQQPVEEDEIARMEDESGPAAMPPGGVGTWVKPAEQHAYPGSVVKLKEGTRSSGGAVLNADHEWHVLRIRAKNYPDVYNVFIGIKGDASRGFWIKANDIAEVVK